MARLTPFTATAHLQQGAALDARYGFAFDGLLATLLRDRRKREQGLLSGAALDGGTDCDDPADVDLPLQRCERGEWHWIATTAYPLDWDGRPLAYEPDVHHIRYGHQREIAEQIAIHLPTHVPSSKGRFRSRRLPVVVFPAAALQFRGVGDIDLITELLADCYSVGANRHSGEGAVTSWTVEETTASDPDRHGHTHHSGALGRPVPVECANHLQVTGPSGPAGLRPPYWHPARRHDLVQPTYHQEADHAPCS